VVDVNQIKADFLPKSVFSRYWVSWRQRSGNRGRRGRKRTSESFDLSTIREKSLKIPENSGTNAPTPLFYLRNATDWWKTSEFEFLFSKKKENMKTFLLKVTQKNIAIFCVCHLQKVCRTNIFRASLGKFGQKCSAPAKFPCSSTCMKKKQFAMKRKMSMWEVFNLMWLFFKICLQLVCYCSRSYNTQTLSFSFHNTISTQTENSRTRFEIRTYWNTPYTKRTMLFARLENI